MLVSDHFFLLYFFPIFIATYLLFGKKITLGNIIIIFFSVFFYASFGLENLPVLIVPLIADYFIAIWIGRTKNKRRRKLLLLIAVVLNILLLGYFKYANFFSSNVLPFFPQSQFLQSLHKNILLPVGISFITFQRISYLVDTFRKTIVPEKNLLKYATYASLFPHLLAGPIVRYSQIKSQLSKRSIKGDTIYFASQLFAAGLAFKVLIADQLYQLEAHLTLGLSGLNSVEALLLILYFSFRIYFDFMGYSLMALGLAKFAGFDFPINFNSPYQSRSITEFWRRWNMTLSSWLRDYLYIPLGGNRKGKSRTYVNLLITMMLAGLWHGASWNFVVWGSLHGIFLAVERFLKTNESAWVKRVKKMPNFVKILYSFSLVTLAWTTFKFTTPQEILLLLSKIVALKIGSFDLLTQNLLIATLPALFAAVVWSFFFREESIPLKRFSYKVVVFFSLLFVIALGYSLIRRGVPFIYFQF